MYILEQFKNKIKNIHAFFDKKVVYKKVLIDWPKPSFRVRVKFRVE